MRASVAVHRCRLRQGIDADSFPSASGPTGSTLFAGGLVTVLCHLGNSSGFVSNVRLHAC